MENVNSPKSPSKKKMPRWKKVLILVGVLTPCAIVATWFGLVYLSFTIDDLTLRYTSDELRFRSFAPIEGSVERISCDEYFDKLELFSNEAPMTAGMFPSAIPDEGSTFFFFSESFRQFLRRHDSYRTEIYLSCPLLEKQYEDEKNRLQLYETTTGNSCHPRDGLFPFPAYIYLYNDGRFLYSLLDEPNLTIHYIFLWEIGSIDNVAFDRTLAPTKPWGLQS